jgi:hypothetical protein
MKTKSWRFAVEKGVITTEPKVRQLEAVNLTESSHSGLTLTPGVVKRIMKELIKHKPRWTTAELIKKVPAIHNEREGLAGKDSVKNVINKALGYLKENGLIVRKDYGVWEKTDGDFDAADWEEEPLRSATVTETKIKVGKTLGEGPESIYIYYHDNDRKLALGKGDSIWQCKIGESGTSDPVERVIAQCGTSRTHPAGDSARDQKRRLRRNGETHPQSVSSSWPLNKE